jgi:hypothetical protein
MFLLGCMGINGSFGSAVFPPVKAGKPVAKGMCAPLKVTVNNLKWHRSGNGASIAPELE